ncbi:MAG: hypothetical protein QOH91_2645 [Mycobacterium sp.]|nr:hypothetical protein [Mycobacterium sp.]
MPASAEVCNAMKAAASERKRGRREVPSSRHSSQAGQTRYPGPQNHPEKEDREQVGKIPTSLCHIRIPAEPDSPGGRQTAGDQRSGIGREVPRQRLLAGEDVRMRRCDVQQQ